MATPQLCDALIIGNQDPEICTGFELPVVIRFGDEPIVKKALRTYHIHNEQDLNHAVYAELGNHAHVVQMARIPIINNTDHSLLNSYIKAAREMVSMLGNCPIDALQGVVHCIKNAHLAGAPDITTMDCGDIPVLAIGGGPSLKHYINRIRDIQDHCLVIACDASMAGLTEAGIRPDISTPLERIPQTIPHYRLPHKAVFCGPPSVHPQTVDTFKKHLFIPTTDFINCWMRPLAGRRVNQGSSTGVLAAIVGRMLSTGTVYLIGHDLCYDGDNSHWEGAHVSAESQKTLGSMEIESPVMCYDGKTRTTIGTWDRLRRELSVYLGHEDAKTVVINPHNAYIPGIPTGTLPFKIKGPKKSLDWGAPRDEKSESLFRDRIERLPGDMRRLRDAMASADTEADLSVFKALPDCDNANIIGLICKSVFAAHLIEHGITKRSVLNPCKEALSNLFDLAIPMIEEACDVAARTRR
jgi:hypothetical protein